MVRNYVFVKLKQFLIIHNQIFQGNLAKLKEADLILSTKYAQWVHYELNYELLQKHQFIKILLEEIKDDDYYRTQIEKNRKI